MDSTFIDPLPGCWVHLGQLAKVCLQDHYSRARSAVACVSSMSESLDSTHSAKINPSLTMLVLANSGHGEYHGSQVGLYTEGGGVCARHLT